MQHLAPRVSAHAMLKEFQKHGIPSHVSKTPEPVVEAGEIIAYANGRFIRQAVRDGQERLVKVMVKTHRRIYRAQDALAAT